MIEPIRLAGFLKWETGSGDVRLCDGGTLVFAGETYRSRHPKFGALASLDPISEGVGDEAPAATLIFSPDPSAARSEICHAGLQNTRLRMWIGEIDRETGALIDGTVEQMFDSIIDVTTTKLSRGKRVLAIDVVSRSERLFLRNEGNGLSSAFHRRIYPGERGLDNMVAVPVTVAWGVTGAPRGTATTSGAFGSAKIAAMQANQ